MKVLLSVIFVLLLLIQSLECKEVEDLLGRRIKVPEKVERLVAIGPGALRMITYLSSVDKVVGVERVEKGGFTPYGRPYTLAIKEKIKDLPLIGEGGPGKLPDFEKIVSVKPDVIFAVGFDRGTMDMIQERTMIPVIALDYGSVGVLRAKKFIDSLTLVGSIVGRENRVMEIDEFLKRTEEYLAQKTLNQKEKPKVYAGGIGFKGQHGITSTEAGFLPFKLVNVKNVVDDFGKDGHLFLEKEKLLSLNPDIIFVDVNGLSIFQKELIDSPGLFMNLKAIKENKLFTILPYNYYNTNVELAVTNAFFIGKVVYPASFKNVNIDEQAERIIRFFVSESVYGEIKRNFGFFGKIVIEKGKITVLSNW
ncbi:MAG: iron ABC transporter substrate-binding protein [Deltaproteobacteria bacterium]|nr:iron ABC transporter substrate-binding protein [Deltaproteobacteria bacterium]